MNIKRHIPNTVTSMNLVCGVLGVICAFGQRFDLAFCLMLAAAVCDFCDGLLARMLDVKSDMGKELDSLSDLVSFGLLPAIMLHRLMVSYRGLDIWSFIPLVIVVFSALRLAKFNIDDRQTHNFIGLATPANALLCGALAYYISVTPDSFLVGPAAGYVFIPLLSVILSALLVSEIPMFSLKFKRGLQKDSVVYRQRIGFFGFCAAATLFVVLTWQNFSLIIIVCVIGYILMNIGYWIASLFPQGKK